MGGGEGRGGEGGDGVSNKITYALNIHKILMTNILKLRESNRLHYISS